ncbi:MAG: DUF1934 domain-containing protein [Epulopiscium sp.]|nr:DUF1934 domain-containing protein [Candidatus Epulonipiscium sp.]
MKKNVLITVTGIQDGLDPSEDIEMVIPGYYYQKQNKFYIIYKESELTGMKDTTTTIKVERDKVSILRFGKNNSSMIFERGKKHTSHYHTVHGEFMISMLTKDMKVNLDQEGGQVYVKYALEVDHMAIGSHSFHVSIRSLTEDYKPFSLTEEDPIEYPMH